MQTPNEDLLDLRFLFSVSFSFPKKVEHNDSENRVVSLTDETKHKKEEQEQEQEVKEEEIELDKALDDLLDLRFLSLSSLSFSEKTEQKQGENRLRNTSIFSICVLHMI